MSIAFLLFKLQIRNTSQFALIYLLATVKWRRKVWP